MTTLTTRTARTSRFSSIMLGLATFGFIGLLGASPAQASPDRGGKDHAAAKADRLCKELSCTPDQKAKIQQIKAAGKTPQNKAAHEEMRALKDQLKAERSKSSPNAATITRLESQLGAKKAVMHSQREARQQQILAVLNADQKAKFQAHIEKRKADKGGKHHGKRAG